MQWVNNKGETKKTQNGWEREDFSDTYKKTRATWI